MFNQTLAFDRPSYLALLAILPLLWWASYRSLSGLGRVRRIVALALRSLVMALLIFALAEMQSVRRSDRVTVIYLLDQSLSVPEEQRREMIDYVNASVAAHHDTAREDRVGVVVFGRDAPVEIPPINDDIQLPASLDSFVDPEFTNLAGAMEKALAIVPHDAAKRVVIVTDGNQNLGDARRQARALVERGVSIDVVPIQLRARAEIAVEKLAIPSEVFSKQPFDLRVVMNNTAAEGTAGQTVRGKLRLVRKTGQQEKTLSEQEIELPPGKKVFSIRQEIKDADFYTYEARFTPENRADDAMPQNNRATTYTHVRGKGHVLFIEDWQSDNKEEFTRLKLTLRNEEIEVAEQTSDQLFSSLAELQRYDAIVLANVPRSSGEDADSVTSFTDEQIGWMVRNTQQMGSGLVMIGGPNSFGAGGWTNTELEKAMPVDFQIKNAKVAPVGALALIMHASEIARGNYWQKITAREAIKALGPHDYCGLIHWSNSGDEWLWGKNQGGMIKVGGARRGMLALLDRMTPGDMPQFDPAMKLALDSFKALDAKAKPAIKHMIIISDGDPSPSSGSLLSAYKQNNIKITTVAVAAHGAAGHQELQRIANRTGGKYYVVKNPRALPRIYQREARRVTRSLFKELNPPVAPRVNSLHEMIKGVEEGIPPIGGFVMTNVKENPLVEVPLISPLPAGKRNSTILAGWTYGLGRTVALTTDAGGRWATRWLNWEGYDKFFSQIIRWSMRPVGESGKFTVATDQRDGKTRVIVTALDKEDEFINFLAMSGSVVGPDNAPREIVFRQTAPGRYVGEFDSRDAGSYFVIVNPGPGEAPVRAGVNVAYSDEFRQQQTNITLLREIAQLKPEGAAPGQLVDSGADAENVTLARLAGGTDPFRHDLPKATASQGVWHLLALLAAVLFFCDVFVRRVHVSFAWVAPLAARARDKLLGREAEAVEIETMSRLRSTKAEVGASIEQRRAAARFEPEPDAPVDHSVLDQSAAASGPPAPLRAKPLAESMAPQQEEESYTSRLLKAKQRARREQGKGETE